MKKEADEIVDPTPSIHTPRTEDTTSDPQTRVGQKTDPAIISLPSASNRAEPTERGQLAHRRATGPRTELGKQRSSQNAIKHGIFSEVTVLKDESRAKYESLLRELWETLRPEGKLEEILVEKLATILWRHRRVLVAEGDEIRKDYEFLGMDQQNQRLDRLLRYEASLERAFDRTLNQLERLQRMRHGQPVPPRIDFTVSS